MTKCQFCSEEIPRRRHGGGKLQRYCSDACRQKAKRRRLDPLVGSEQRKANQLQGLELRLDAEAREWARRALVKARLITGDPDDRPKETHRSKRGADKMRELAHAYSRPPVDFTGTSAYRDMLLYTEAKFIERGLETFQPTTYSGPSTDGPTVVPALMPPRRHRRLRFEDFDWAKVRLDAALARCKTRQQQAWLMAFKFEDMVGGEIANRLRDGDSAALTGLEREFEDWRRRKVEEAEFYDLVFEWVRAQPPPNERDPHRVALYVPSLVNEPQIARSLGYDPEELREVYRLEAERSEVTVAEHRGLKEQLDRIEASFTAWQEDVKGTLERVQERFPDNQRVAEAVDKFIATALEE